MAVTRRALANEGFGVLSEIDVQAILKAKPPVARAIRERLARAVTAACAATAGRLMALWPFSRGATISVAEASTALTARDVMLLDVRECSEFDSAHPRQARHLPLSRLDAASLSPDTRYLLICHSGARSAMAPRSLRRAGLDVTNVAAG